MSRGQDFAAERLDRRDAHGVRKARHTALDRLAERAVAVAMPTRADGITFLRLVVGHAQKRLTALDSRHHADSYLAALSRGDDFRSLTKSLAQAEWASLFAANDGGGHD